jgi:hypothetical protein
MWIYKSLRKTKMKKRKKISGEDWPIDKISKEVLAI